MDSSFLDNLPTASEGSYRARLLADSVNSSGDRLSTFELTFPRMVLSEFNTHREFSRNSASSRAIPVTVQIRKILAEPFVPDRFGINEPGMQASTFLTGDQHEEQVQNWLRARGRAVLSALEQLLGVQELTRILGDHYWYEFDPFTDEETTVSVLSALVEFTAHVKEMREQDLPQTRYLNVHKQSANRVLEPYAWHTVLVSATQWSNFWALRDSPMAQPEIATIARLARSLHAQNRPAELTAGQWHLPLLAPSERAAAATAPEYWREVVVGRCARVSYETHDGRRDPDADRSLALRLAAEGHMSPFEHVASAGSDSEPSGNFRGWHQYRKALPNEQDFALVLAALED